MLEANATRGFPEETEETECESAGGEACSVQVIRQHEQESREPGAYDPTVRVSGSPPGPVEIRPFLLLDAEPGMRQRFEACCILRAELAEQAAKT